MAKAELKIIGSSPARMGGVERVIGKGVYGIDLMLKDQLHGAILRSQYAHAKIVSIDTSEAKKIPGVHAVVTAEDAPNVRYGRSYIDRHILARGKVRFMGDPVAAVAAESPAIARQALKKIKVVYEPLPVVIDPEEATKPTAPTLHDDMPLPKTIPADGKLKNICGHAVVHVGDAEKAMAEADIVVEMVSSALSRTIITGRLALIAKRPQIGSMAAPEVMPLPLPPKPPPKPAEITRTLLSGRPSIFAVSWRTGKGA